VDGRNGRDAELTFALPLIDAARERGFNVETAIMERATTPGHP